MPAVLTLSLVLASANAEVLVLGVDDAGVPARDVAAEATQVLIKRGRSAVRPQRVTAPDLTALDEAQRAAENHYIEGDLQTASAELRAIIETLERAERLTPEHTARAQALRLQLAKWTFTGDEAAAREVFASAVRADPALQLDAARYPPKLRAVFDEVRARVLGEPTGAVEVRSDPPGAKVFVDGRELGTTPVSLTQLPAGPHAVWIEREGLSSRVRPARPGETRVISFDLLEVWVESRDPGPPPVPLDAAALARIGDGRAVLLLTHAMQAGAPFLTGAFFSPDAVDEAPRLGAVEVVGGAADVGELVRGLVEGGASDGPRPAWLLPPRPVTETEGGEPGGDGWLWIATAVGAGVLVAASATAVGLALVLPPSEGRFNVELVP